MLCAFPVRNEKFFFRRKFLRLSGFALDFWGMRCLVFAPLVPGTEKSDPGKLTPMVLFLNRLHTTLFFSYQSEISLAYQI